jgi:predicted nuclease of restriction endonuclease-like (RecB) superfamily
MNIGRLLELIQNTCDQAAQLVLKQVNTNLSIRNWLIGFYLFEYEQGGADRAIYGESLYRTIESELKSKGIKGLSYSILHVCKQFYLTYPQIGQTVSDQMQKTGITMGQIVQTVSGQSVVPDQLVPEKFSTLSRKLTNDEELSIDPALLLQRLSFSHFIELLNAETALKRAFYEIETIKNNWSVRELKRAMSTLLFERTGLSKNKKAVIGKIKDEFPDTIANVMKNPYILEFLGLEEKPQYSETDLENAIITHLQKFLIELGRGFCFEARQKRITFDNDHYRIDLVFYHRILKCHVLIDLKIGKFSHADAGQMNVYLNYYKENEMTEGDNPPIGIIMCAQKNDSLVKYATGGLPQKVFVSKYMVELPSVDDLKKLLEADREQFGGVSNEE